MDITVAGCDGKPERPGAGRPVRRDGEAPNQDSEAGWTGERWGMGEASCFYLLHRGGLCLGVFYLLGLPSASAVS